MQYNLAVVIPNKTGLAPTALFPSSNGRGGRQKRKEVEVPSDTVSGC